MAHIRKIGRQTAIIFSSDVSRKRNLSDPERGRQSVYLKPRCRNPISCSVCCPEERPPASTLRLRLRRPKFAMPYEVLVVPSQSIPILSLLEIPQCWHRTIRLSWQTKESA